MYHSALPAETTIVWPLPSSVLAASRRVLTLPNFRDKPRGSSPLGDHPARASTRTGVQSGRETRIAPFFSTPNTKRSVVTVFRKRFQGKVSSVAGEFTLTPSKHRRRIQKAALNGGMQPQKKKGRPFSSGRVCRYRSRTSALPRAGCAPYYVYNPTVSEKVAHSGT